MLENLFGPKKEDGRKNNGQHPNSIKHRWKPGESGNPAGKPLGTKDKNLANYLEALLSEVDKDGYSQLEKALRTMIGRAIEGSDGALREMLDRRYGKAPDTININSQPKKYDLSKLNDEQYAQFKQIMAILRENDD